MIRIATKLSFSLVTAGFIIFGIYGIYHLRTERVDLRRVVEHETRLLGYSFQVAIENALRDQQYEDVRMLLRPPDRGHEPRPLRRFDGVALHPSSG
jgi:hypothetical protein